MDAVEKARRGAGTRGTVGAPTPKKGAPAKAKARVSNPSRRTGTKAKAALEGQHGLLRVKAHASMPPVQHGGFTCASCGYMSHREHPVMASNGKPHPTMAMRGCARCGTMHPVRKGAMKHHVDDVDVAKAYAADLENESENDVVSDVQKDVDSTDTAIQRQDVEHTVTDLVGHRENCPRGGSAPCGKEVKGECTKCGSMVRDHEALGKRGLNATVLDLMKLAADL